MAETLPVTKPARPSPSTLVLTSGAVAFAVVLVIEALALEVLRGPQNIGVSAALALVSALLIGPLLYLIVIRPLMDRLAHHAAIDAAAVQDATPVETVDPVTHVLNRRGITASLLEAMAQSQRYATPLCVAFVGIDGFDRLRERHGDAFGDQAVQWTAAALTDALRLPDRVGRYEGAEFLVVMPQTRAPAATKVAERLRAAIDKSPATMAGVTESLTISVGVVEFSKGHDLEKLLSQGQAALSQAHHAGGNRVTRLKTVRRRDVPETD
ncbi:MAG: GGDEF domain-containing protein [Acidiferrobacteraceae bacterium]